MYPQRRCFAACSGFQDIGPASRNPQLIVIHKQTRQTLEAMASRRSHAASYSRNYFICLHPPIAEITSLVCTLP